MKYVPPGQPGSIVTVNPRYENFIGGKWLAPTDGKYRVDLSPATARPIAEVADSTPADIELALDAAHAAKDGWGEASATERAAVLNKIADVIEANREMLAVAESWENGKPVRETLDADLPLVVDHFRYFAAAHPRRGGAVDGDRQGPGRLPLPRAAGRRRSDHPVQLPAADGGVEAGAGAGGGQLLGAQARVADSVVDPEAHGGHRGRRAAGRDQRRDRSGRGDRQGARREPADRQDRLHG